MRIAGFSVMADCLIAVSRGVSQNRFVASFAADIDLLPDCDIACDIVIDTGCSFTKLAASSFGGSVDYTYLHELDIRNYKTGKVGLIPSFGTTDTDRFIDLRHVSDKSLRTDARICFKHNLSNIVVNSYSFDKLSEGCKIAYIRSGSSLLGMNILNKMDFHCGRSRILNRFVFIGCLRSEINEGYLQVLSEHLGFLPNTRFIRQLIEQGKIDVNRDFIKSEYSFG